MPSPTLAGDQHDRIRLLAHSLWEEEGRPDGRAEFHWTKAEEIIRARAAKPVKKAAARARTRKA